MIKDGKYLENAFQNCLWTVINGSEIIIDMESIQKMLFKSVFNFFVAQKFTKI